MATVFTSVLLMLAMFLVLRFRSFEGIIYLLSRNKKAGNIVIENSIEEMNVIPAEGEHWWNLLDLSDQLNLALLLTQKALPVWEKYNDSNQVVYKNSSTGPYIKIERQLLQNSIDEIIAISKVHFPGKENINLKKCYNGFVGPLIAMQDGNWPATYPVKKIFLSVYYILKGILEQDNIPGMKNLLATSISQSLDCLDMSKLYSRDEIEIFLEVYKTKLLS